MQIKFPKTCIAVKVDEAETGSDVCYVADIKCPICSNITKAFYKSYEETKKGKTINLTKMWFFNNFMRHVKTHSPDDDENGIPVKKINRKRKFDACLDSKQATINFKKAVKPVQNEDDLENVDLTQDDDNIEKVNDGNEGQDDDNIEKGNDGNEGNDGDNDNIAETIVQNEYDDSDDDEPLLKRCRKIKALSTASDDDSGEE